MIDKGHVFLVIPPNTFYFDVSDVKNEVFIRKFKVFHIQSTEENWQVLPQKKVDEPETLSNISYDGNFSSAENIFSTRLCILQGDPHQKDFLKWHFEKLHL